MALDAVTTSLVGISVGAIGVVSHTVAHWTEGGLARSRERTILALFFAFLSGFLLPWIWVFSAESLLATTAFPGAVVGLLWGGLVWGAFILPAELSHVIWGREAPRSASAALAAWLAQFLIGGLVAGAVLVP